MQNRTGRFLKVHATIQFNRHQAEAAFMAVTAVTAASCSLQDTFGLPTPATGPVRKAS